MISISSLRNTSSNPSVNFWSRSRIRKRRRSERSANVEVTLARALDDPWRSGMQRTSDQVHTTAAQLDEEQDVEALQPQCLHREEIDGQHAVAGLHAQTRARRFLDASPTAQDPMPSATSAPSSLRPTYPDPSAHQQSVDSPTAGCLARDGAPVLEALVASVVGLRDARRSNASPPKRRCHRSSVAGVIMNDRQCPLDRNRLAAARKSRSIVVSAGRLRCRCRMATSCRRTTISSSLKSFDRTRKAAIWRSRRSTK
jgi:hypothetical protein